MITGDTGSGKTTQVPQYLMELFAERNEPVRIICTQPRRIAAISVAERVAHERAERPGGTVGYQIRLESRMSSKTALVYCTTGILLRTLMYHDNNLERVTHLLIDEVHERDRFCDFLLGVLRSRLPRFPNLRLILMSAALDINVFSGYFSNCPVFHIQGKCFPVRQYFLEDALQLTNHLGRGMEIGVWTEEDAASTKTATNMYGRNLPDGRERDRFSFVPVATVSEYWLNDGEKAVFDTLIQEAFLLGREDTVEHLADAVKNSTMPVNYQHSETHLTPLMAVAGIECIL